MEKYTSMTVDVNANGTVRIYGNGGMIFEAQSDYVSVETRVDANIAAPSGTVKPKDKK